MTGALSTRDRDGLLAKGDGAGPIDDFLFVEGHGGGRLEKRVSVVLGK